MKRLFDVIVAGVGIVLLAPAMAIVAVMIRLGGDGPVLFKQQRVGRRLKLFNILKFRTMVVAAPALGPGVTIGTDARVTRIGHVLRRTKLDELPQLFNVFRGDMSFVGPRPELKRYVDLYQDDFAGILKRVRPGITDIASIVYRDESGILGRAQDPEAYYANVILPDKIRMSKEYVRNSSVLYDLRLILATLTILLYPKRGADRVFEILGRWRVPIAVFTHAVAFGFANWGAYMIRFEGRVPAYEWQRFVDSMPWLVMIRLVVFAPLGLYRNLWRYSGLRDLQRLALGLTLSSGLFWLLMRWIPDALHYSRAVGVIDWMLCLVVVGGLRVLRRLQSRVRTEVPRTRRALLVASGDVADRVVRSIVSDPLSGYQVIGVLEQDAHRRGATLQDVPVLGAQSELEALVVREDPDEILIAGASGQVVRQMVKLAARYEKPVRVIPDPHALVAGDAVLLPTRTFEPEDLLFREPIHTDPGVLEAFYSDKRVLITGAGGSIGAEICRQISKLKPSRLILFEKHEASLFFIERELRAAIPQLELVPVIGDITDAERVGQILSATRPQIVFHAAAYKHVPMMEHHPSEARKTNVLGTRIVAQAAAQSGAEVFVLISTDKAVEPVSTMGLTKRIAELTVLGMNGEASPRYMAVRFGNVLDSSGSVVPLFREQIEKGGPITVTHAEVTRLFMTVPEAVQLILHAGTMGQGGEVFVLDMGKPVRILDLAKTLARFHGLHPGRDIDIVFTGLRPGERLFESLFNDHEKVWKTTHPKILKAANGSAGTHGREELTELLKVLDDRIRSVALTGERADAAPEGPRS